MLIEVIERRPAQLTIFTVNTSGFGLQLMTNILIGLNLAPRGRCNLRIADFTVVLRELLQQGFIGMETFRQALRVVQPLNGEDVFHICQLGFKLRQLRR